ncbi:MAG: DUF3772 domain-containing protein, partial [Janthinobacterium lividum]
NGMIAKEFRRNIVFVVGFLALALDRPVVAAEALASNPVRPVVATAAVASPASPAIGPVASRPPATTATPAAAVAADPNIKALAVIVGTVDGLRKQAVGASTDASLARLREEIAAAEVAADNFVAARSRDIALVDRQLRPLSTASGATRKRLTLVEQRERRELSRHRGILAGQTRTAQQAAAAAVATYNEVSQRRRTAFDARTFDPTASPLELDFWTSLADSLPTDSVRLGRLIDEEAHTVAAAPEPDAAASVLVSLMLAAALAWPIRRRLLRLAPHLARVGTDATSFHRTAHALASTLINTILPGLAAVVLNLGLRWGALFSERAAALMHGLVIAVFWGAAVVSLTRQLVGVRREDRLLAVSDQLARSSRTLSWLVALVTGAGFLLSRINNLVGASLAATVASNCLMSLAYAAIAGLILLALSKGAPSADVDAAEEVVRAPGVTLIALALSTTVVVTVVSVFAGLTTFASLVSGQIFWISMLAATTYLILQFADDAVTELYQPAGWLGRLLSGVLNLGGSTIGQLGVLSSALLRVVIVIGALSLALTPFGRNGNVLDDRLGGLGQAVHLGSLVISPKSLAAGVGCLLLGLGVVHLVQRWMDRRFLPVTGWDAGVRNSVSTGVRYLGVAVVLLWAMAAAGLGFSQIALIASALSVGIGFGLQNIVQNFVSGIILLIERPIKVGDWVSVGGVDGDVKRIRVRATEIQQFDRTTLIVPNSDLITKPVQNKTLGDPRGRVQLQLTIGAAGDTPRAIEVIRKVLDEAADVVTDPSPKVFVDSLTPGGAVNFNALAYVGSQRDAYRVRSDLYVRVIQALNDAGIGFAGAGGQTITVEPGPELKAVAQQLADDMRQPKLPAAT